MLHDLNVLVGAAVMQRLTLFVNHVIASEPVASSRLVPHSGRCLQLHFDAWPRVLPPLPPAAFRVTPAGLVEWCGAEGCTNPDLRVTIDASNPAQVLVQAVVGTRPKVDLAGDAAFATDLNWLFDNLRWDAQDDLAGIVGQAPAREIARIAGGIATGVRDAAKTLSELAARR